MTIEFDPFGFSVKNFQTGMPLMRCESWGMLYPITESTTPATSYSTFAALAPSLWHERLGHSGVFILHSLRKNKLLKLIKLEILVFFIHVLLENILSYLLFCHILVLLCHLILFNNLFCHILVLLCHLEDRLYASQKNHQIFLYEQKSTMTELH